MWSVASTGNKKSECKTLLSKVVKFVGIVSEAGIPSILTFNLLFDLGRPYYVLQRNHGNSPISH